jgi:hypothetical protein
MTLNKQSKASINAESKTSMDEVVMLEIEKNGNVSRVLADSSVKPLTLKNTLLRRLYPEIRVIIVTVPTDPLDAWEETQVETAMRNLVLDGVRYMLAGGSGGSKKGKFYFVDSDHSELLAKRFRHNPQVAVVHFGILVSSCMALLEEPDARVLVVKDTVLGTNDCRGWLSWSLFRKLQAAHKSALLFAEKEKLLAIRMERFPAGQQAVPPSTEDERLLLEEAERNARGKLLPAHCFYQFRLALGETQAKGSFKIMDDGVAEALEADIVLPESAVRPELAMPITKIRSFGGEGRIVHGPIVLGIREYSRPLEFESSYTLVEHAPEDSIHLEILPEAIAQVRKVSQALNEGCYDELLELLGRKAKEPDSFDPRQFEDDEELRITEALLAADKSGHVVRHPFVNSQLNRILARWAFKTSTGGGFHLPAFALADDGFLLRRNGKVYWGSNWIPQDKAITSLASKRGLCVRYPIRMYEDLLPFESMGDEEIVAYLGAQLRQQGCPMTPEDIKEVVAQQLRLESTYVLHATTAKKNGGDYDFDWVCVLEADRFPRFVEGRFHLNGQVLPEKNKAKKKSPWWNLEHVAMKARGNQIGAITDLQTSCLAADRRDLAYRLVLELQNALDSLKFDVEPDQNLIAEIRKQVAEAPWLRYKREQRISDLPLNLDVLPTDRIGWLYNYARKEIDELISNPLPIEAFRGLIVGEPVTREMFEECRRVNTVYGTIMVKSKEREAAFKDALAKAQAEYEAVRQNDDKELRKQKREARNQARDACHHYEKLARKERRAVILFVRVWADSKKDDRLAWCQALNTIVCNGHGNGSLLFHCFPQEVVIKLAERTGGQAVAVALPKAHAASLFHDEDGRAFLVEPTPGGEKLEFVVQYKDGKLVFEDTTGQA